MVHRELFFRFFWFLELSKSPSNEVVASSRENDHSQHSSNNSNNLTFQANTNSTIKADSITSTHGINSTHSINSTPSTPSTHSTHSNNSANRVSSTDCQAIQGFESTNMASIQEYSHAGKYSKPRSVDIDIKLTLTPKYHLCLITS